MIDISGGRLEKGEFNRKLDVKNLIRWTKGRIWQWFGSKSAVGPMTHRNGTCRRRINSGECVERLICFVLKSCRRVDEEGGKTSETKVCLKTIKLKPILFHIVFCFRNERLHDGYLKFLDLRDSV